MNFIVHTKQASARKNYQTFGNLKYENVVAVMFFYFSTGWPYCEAFNEAEWTDDSE